DGRAGDRSPRTRAPMFRSFHADTDADDDRRSDAPAVRTVLGLLHRLNTGQGTDEHFAPRARLLGGPFPGLRAEQPTLDRQLAAIAANYEIHARADALLLSPDGRVLLTGVFSATRRPATGGFAEAFAWLFGCAEDGRTAEHRGLARVDLPAVPQ
ncbi:MAG TPA: hypothetical protein PLE54_18740, partial [Burkholderiaceae bacterium]|nr:hypothetical protein [Burkholderiaceae bacterium]